MEDKNFSSVTGYEIYQRIFLYNDPKFLEEHQPNSDASDETRKKKKEGN